MEERGRHPVIVIGGGLAGLAAAVELSAAHIPVLLVEHKPSLGGRARSYVDTVTGDEIDNGQHLLIAGYTQTLGFLERIGTRHLVDVQDRPILQFHHPDRGFVDFRLSSLPSPLHALSGIVSTSLLAGRDRYALLRGGAALLCGSDQAAAGMTIAQWLDAHRQPAETRRCFWEPMAVAIMNEHANRASARLFLAALRQAFFRHRAYAALVFPRVGLSRLFAEPARSLIERSGGEVRCNAGAARVVVQGGRATEVVLNNRARVSCSAVVLAVPAPQAMSMMSGVDVPGLAAMAGAEPSPIIGIHLWMDRSVMDHEAVGLIGKRIQWVFRRDHHLSLVMSAAREFMGLSSEELTRIALEDLRAVFGESICEPKRSLVIREKRATCSLTPEVAESRPKAGTNIENLYLSGDWTDTALPATIEGAIVSGQHAARLAAGSLRLNRENGIL